MFVSSCIEFPDGFWNYIIYSKSKLRKIFKKISHLDKPFICLTVLVRCWCVNHSRYNPLLSRVSSLPDLIISVSSYRTLFLEKYGKPSRFEKVWHLILPMFVFSWFEKLWKVTLQIFFFCPFEKLWKLILPILFFCPFKNYENSFYEIISTKAQTTQKYGCYEISSIFLPFSKENRNLASQ